MTKEELTKLLMESYQRGQADLMESCKEAAIQTIDMAIAQENEACALIADEAEPYNAADLIRKRMKK